MGKKKNRYKTTTIKVPEKNYNGIDLIKFICAFLVLIIHVPPFNKESFDSYKELNFVLQMCVCRIAVPFFMVSSGFLLFRKMDLYSPQKDIVKSYSFNLLRLAGLWSLLLVFGSEGHLWYLGAMVVAALAVYLLFHWKVKIGWLIVICSVFYLIGLTGDSYYGIVEPLGEMAFFEHTAKTYIDFFYTTRNGIFMGMMFMLIGALFAHKKIRMSLFSSTIGFMFSVCLLIFEAQILNYNDIPKDYNMYICLIPATIFLFGIAVNLNLKDRPIYRKLRGVGVLVYFLHLFVRKLISYVFDIINESNPLNKIDYTRYAFIMTVVLTVAIAFLIEYLSHKNKLRWLRWLYS